MEEKEADGIRRIIIIDNSSWWIFLSYIVGSKITVYLDILYFVDSDGCRRNSRSWYMARCKREKTQFNAGQYALNDVSYKEKNRK